ncbi:hypothetical protein AB1Y20_021014 [Prymnesium parvum]|uniref:Uncharacterized protein n=1 Tax=Prymnesium parvum TaxID=97485 RepID=A0AB34JKV1_PRYPA
MQGGGEESEGGAPEVLRKSRKRRPSLGHLQQLAEARLAKERKHLQHTVLDCDDNFLSPEAAHVRQTEVEPEADMLQTSKFASVNVPLVRCQNKCSLCGGLGHNVRTCRGMHVAST